MRFGIWALVRIAAQRVLGFSRLCGLCRSYIGASAADAVLLTCLECLPSLHSYFSFCEGA